MNTDIRISVEFWGHHKTKKLIARLGLEAVRSLQVLWCWAARNRPDGILKNMDDEDIELVAEWTGEPKAFISTCQQIGWIDADADNDENTDLTDSQLPVDSSRTENNTSHKKNKNSHDTVKKYRLHDWAEHNSWAANFDDRSDLARFKRLAHVNRPAYEHLKSLGYLKISKEEYSKFAKNKANCQSTGSQHDVDYSSNTQSTPTPNPDPYYLDHIFCVGSPDGLPTQKADEPDTKPKGKRGRPRKNVEPDETGMIPLPEIMRPKVIHTKAPACPHEEIIAAYHEELPELASVKVWNTTRKSHLQARWQDRFIAGKYTLREEGIAYWRRVFKHIHDNCDFLMGKIHDRNGRIFKADLAWIVCDNNFAKIIEGKYDNREE